MFWIHNQKNRLRLRILNLSNPKICLGGEHKSRFDIFIEQLMDSGIVGGIAGVSAYLAAGENATLKCFLIAFGLTFLFKLKEYRKIDVPKQPLIHAFPPPPAGSDQNGE